MHRFVLVYLVGLLAGCAAPVGLGAGATRTAVDVTNAPWRSVGAVETDVGGHCTGALISPRIALTAAHCLVDPRTGRPLDPRFVQFVLAPSPSGDSGRARATALVIGPGFAVAPGPRPVAAAPPDADWAVLLLDTAVGTPERALRLEAGYPPPGTPLRLGGYQVDQGRQMVADAACAVAGYARDAAGRVMMRHTCAATLGASGGPLLTETATGWVVVGVASLGEGGVSGGWAVPTAAIAQAVRAAARPGST